MSNQNRIITIGKRDVEVPPGYIQTESDFCHAEYDAFVETPTNITRQAVLDKRVEFYNLFKEGSVIIPDQPESEDPWWLQVWNIITTIITGKNNVYKPEDSDK